MFSLSTRNALLRRSALALVVALLNSSVVFASETDASGHAQAQALLSAAPVMRTYRPSIELPATGSAAFDNDAQEQARSLLVRDSGTNRRTDASGRSVTGAASPANLR